MAGRKLDLLLLNPSSRTEVYQSLGAEAGGGGEPRLGRADGDVLPHARDCRSDLIDAEAEELTAEQVAERVRDARPGAGGRGGLRTSALRIDADHDGRRPGLHGDQAAGARAEGDARRRPRRRAAGAHAARRRTPISSPPARGCTPSSILVAALKTPAPNLAASAGPVVSRRRRPAVRHRRPAAGRRPRRARCRRSLGPAADGHATAPTTGTASTAATANPTPPSTRPSAVRITARSAASRRRSRSGERAGGRPETSNSYRYWSADAVLAEIDVLVERYGVRNIKIADEMFVLNRRHVLGICERPHPPEVRPQHLGLHAGGHDQGRDARRRCRRPASPGWRSASRPAPTASAPTWTSNSTSNEVFEVVDRVRAAGINVIGNYIFGLPEDDADTMRATLDLAVELNCEFANFYSAMAYPGSPLYDLAAATERAAAGRLDRLLAALARLPAAADAPRPGPRSPTVPRRGVSSATTPTRIIWK